MPTMALVGEAGPEAVIPLDRGGAGGRFGLGTTINQYLAIDENPLQTFEGLRRQREFTLKTMQRSLVTSLQQAVASGRA